MVKRRYYLKQYKLFIKFSTSWQSTAIITVLNNTIQSWVMKEKHGGGIALLLKPISPLASADCAPGWMRVIASSFRWSQLYRLVLLTVLVGTRFVHEALRRWHVPLSRRVSPLAFMTATSFSVHCKLSFNDNCTIS